MSCLRLEVSICILVCQCLIHLQLKKWKMHEQRGHNSCCMVAGNMETSWNDRAQYGNMAMKSQATANLYM